MKKRVATVMAVILLIMACGIFSGCKRYWQDYLPEYENEFFKYAVYEKKEAEKRGYYYEDESTRGFIIGFTDIAAQQKFLVLPNVINDIPIVDFGYQRNSGMKTENVWENIGSDNLIKLYIPFALSNNQWRGGASGISLPNCYLCQWKGRDIYLLNRGGNYNRIISGEAALSYFCDGLNTEYYEGRDKLANIIYKLNYRYAPDDGYYWVDSYDNSTVEFIPPEPKREGYLFAGWFKEPECTNKWDFETDKTGEEIKIIKNTIFDDYANHEITNLYAKWVQE